MLLCATESVKEYYGSLKGQCSRIYSEYDFLVQWISQNWSNLSGSDFHGGGRVEAENLNLNLNLFLLRGISKITKIWQVATASLCILIRCFTFTRQINVFFRSCFSHFRKVLFIIVNSMIIVYQHVRVDSKARAVFHFGLSSFFIFLAPKK